MPALRMISGTAAALALVATSATPAFARNNHGYNGYGYGYGYNDYGGRRHHRRHRDNVDTGDVIGAIAVVGIIAAIASAASKAKRAKQATSNGGFPNQRGAISNENAAVDACAEAAEKRGGQTASVREIVDVKTSSDGWDVEGTLEQRRNWRDKTSEKRRFTCSVRFGAVDSVYIDGDAVALR
jgi:hypothetical protein